jgi:hypothetical protein
MSMIGEYRRVESNKLQDLLKDPESLMNFLFEANDPENSLNVDKSWHIIHFLLNDDPWEGSPPLFNAVLGGTEIGDTDNGYGPARYLTPEQVNETTNTLVSVPPEAMIERYDSTKANKSKIYTGNWSDSDEDREYISSNYKEIVNFFQKASDQKQAVLLWLS